MPIRPGLTGRRLGVAALCLGFAAVSGSGVARADDPAPPPAPDPSTIINQANTILPMIGTVVQYLPTLLDPNVAPLNPSGTGVLQPPMQGLFSPSG